MTTAVATENPLKGKGLSQDVIRGLMSQGRTRGVYNECLSEFVDSDEAGVDVAETWPLYFTDKPASTLYQGFNNVINKLGEDCPVKVKRIGDNVYLFHTDRIELSN